jgi:hypothetical protein
MHFFDEDDQALAEFRYQIRKFPEQMKELPALTSIGPNETVAFQNILKSQQPRKGDGLRAADVSIAAIFSSCLHGIGIMIKSNGRL